MRPIRAERLESKTNLSLAGNVRVIRQNGKDIANRRLLPRLCSFLQGENDLVLENRMLIEGLIFFGIAERDSLLFAPATFTAFILCKTCNRHVARSL